MPTNGKHPPENLFTPKVARGGAGWVLLMAAAKDLMKVPGQPLPDLASINGLRERLLAMAAALPEDVQVSRVTVSILCDLRAQGWAFARVAGGITLTRPQNLQSDPQLERARVRAGHAIERDSQLGEEPVRQFIRDMERPRLGPEGWVSIYSLMRDGRNLAAGLERVLQAPAEQRVELLNGVIDPYIQVVDEDAVCQFTALRLADVWRYFRYTWASAHQSVPGRTMQIIVRDRAAQSHPVIGIAALSSPVVHLSKRDAWIGWAPGQVTDAIAQNPTQKWAKWLNRSLDSLIGEIFLDDFIKEKILQTKDIESPDDAVIGRLLTKGEEARDVHRRYPSKSVLKSSELSPEQCLKRAKTFLFQSKRAFALAELLATRQRLQKLGFQKATVGELKTVLGTAEGRKAIETIRRYVKSIHVGNDVLDISICGAVAPYNPLLGGKLVAMLLTSPEVSQAYARRYGKNGSIIASSIAGRPIRRKPKLVLLTTTSLYGSELSQYTRLSVPAAVVNGDPRFAVRYENLGSTEGQGSYHLSGRTVGEIEVALSHLQDGRRINSIFGEGVNPRLRKLRTGLDVAGFPADHVLEHGRPRVFYAIALASNIREFLLGLEAEPLYLLPQAHPAETTAAIGSHWKGRWLVNRLGREGLLDSIRRHTLAHPIEHGARVVLPYKEADAPLFGDE